MVVQMLSVTLCVSDTAYVVSLVSSLNSLAVLDSGDV